MKSNVRLLLLLVFLSIHQAGWSQVFNGQLKVVTIELIGNDKTRDQVIIRELAFEIGDEYDSSRFADFIIPRSESNLQNIDLFNKIQISYTYLASKGLNDSVLPIAVKVELVERWYLWPIPFVEYVDRNFNEWIENGMDLSRTNYGLYLFKYNAFGKNQTIKLHLIDGYNRAVGFQYTVPWLWRNPHLGLDLKFGWKSRKEVWYDAQNNKLQMYRDLDQRIMERWESMMMVNYRPGLYNWHKPYLIYNRSSVDESVLQDSLNPQFLSNGQNQQLLQLGYVWFREKRNNKCLPTTGNYQKIDLSFQKYSGVSGAPAVAFETGGFQPLNRLGLKRFSIAGYLSGRWKPEKIQPYEYRSALGYDQYLRGYERYVIDGTSYLLFKSEIRLHIFRERYFNLKYMTVQNYKSMPVESFLSVFADQAYVNNPDKGNQNSYANSHQIGYGIGLNTMFYLDKVLRFEYSVNKFGDAGFRIHFHQSI